MTRLTPKNARTFILDNTALMAPPHVPEVLLHLADEAHDLWLRTEEELAEIGLPPPFWAFAWAGGQGLARYVLDHPATLQGKRVLDFASGSGMVAIAALKAGAAELTAADIDPFCATVIALNLEANGVKADFLDADSIGTDDGWDVVLAGDVFYDKPLAERLTPWFTSLKARGADILVGDPGRAYLPKTGLQSLAVYQVPVTRVLEDAEVKRTTVWRWVSAASA
ncbi:MULTISPECIES: methyltransferase [unclassified Mesorhizobium]|uniref:class I SAM-dependent methyltransferase n=1 Tax=unclassified Mesorhizobium TaxID=325217 RepID=UPI000F74D6B4|nr:MULTISPECIES: methyltransferase [unclassified Mesorhizobium]TGV94248.1 methyltransferase [Mesorhizobium sp. M00.F.Ca.ET.158.01.1.1]AZO60617.1 methyltransferase [Mesorhizobium sp. M1A.F.Ca.IN.022.06.1.1]MDG4899004.1 methyltransferase [Mesorhizobium sp. WSM4962]MDG4918759.1 methyltransferase [Mesorhizobium sp. WSM4989]RUV15236.1 methyltransferase [Mesorhizobium sp. M1A.F.Ca.IN.022.04.1.1]